MKTLYFVALSFLLPVVTFAQIDPGEVPDSRTFDGNFLEGVLGVINDIVPILIGLGVLGFLWGVVQFIIAGDAEEKKEKAKNTMIYGIVGIFVMVAIWGIIAFIADSLGVGVGGELQDAPGIDRDANRQ